MRWQPGIRVPVVRVEKVFIVPVLCVCIGSALLASLPASAATVTVFDPGNRRGGPIAQMFLEDHGKNVSLVRTQDATSCVASRVLPIADASYLAPDGSPVSHDDVIRSPASSIQAIARPGEPVTFRVQLKYSPDPSRPVEMRIGSRTFDLVDALEPSGDSLLLTGDAAERLAQALQDGTGLTTVPTAGPTLQAVSAATGRQVTDRLLAPDMGGLDACLATLRDLPAAEDPPTADASDHVLAESDMSGPGLPDVEARAADARTTDVPEDAGIAADDTDTALPVMPAPVIGLRLEFTARPDPDLRVDPDALTQCRMRDIPDEVFLGQLKTVTGFFSQTQDVYVAFDDRGALQRAYIPGIFDSDLSPGANRAHVSLAADSNLPDRPNTVRGCLGDAPLEAPVCAIPTSQAGSYTVAECGVLGMSQTREEYLGEVPGPFFDATPPARMSTGRTPGGVPSFSRPFGSRDFSGGGGFLGGGGGGGGGQPGPGGFFPGGDPPPPGGGGTEVPAVPLPAALWMSLLALTGLSGVGVLKHRKAPL